MSCPGSSTGISGEARTGEGIGAAGAASSCRPVPAGRPSKGERKMDGNAGFQAFGRNYASEREAIVGLIDILRAEESAAGRAIASWVTVCKDPYLRGGLAWVAQRESFHGDVFGQRLRELGEAWQAVPGAYRGADYDACLADPSVPDAVKMARLVGGLGDTEAVIAPVREFAERIVDDPETREALRLYCEDEISSGRWLCEACDRLGVAHDGPSMMTADAA